MKRLMYIALALFAASIFAGCGDSVSTDEIGVKYSGGSMEGKKFDKVVDPGTVDTFLVNDTIYRLPLSQVTYSVRVDDDDDEGNNPDVDGVIAVPVIDPETKISTELNYMLNATLMLNTTTKDIEGFEGGTFRRFFEKLCRAYKCWLDGDSNRTAGWRKMLREKLYAALEAAVKDNARKYPPENQVNNTEVDDPENPGKKIATLSLLARNTARSFIIHLERQVGGKFFCGPSFERNTKDGEGNFECPAPELLITSADYANPEIRRSREAKQVANNLNSAKDTLEESIKDPNYLRYLEIQACKEMTKGTCFFGVNGGTPLAVPAGR